MFNQLFTAPMPEELRPTWSKFTKGVCQAAQKVELLKTRLNNITAAENACKARQRQSNKVFMTGGILYAKDAWHMVQDQLELKEKKEKEREEAWGKWYKLALQKCYKQIKKWRST